MVSLEKFVFCQAILKGVFTPLKQVDFFKQVFVNDGVVTWPGELDLAPDAAREMRMHRRDLHAFYSKFLVRASYGSNYSETHRFSFSGKATLYS